MRFTRAAKVAAFPLLAMVLVVALIACTGPAGPAGPAATAVPGTDGTTGPRGDDALEAHAIDVVIFNPVDDDNDVETTKGPEVTIDLNMHLTGGVAEGRKFQIVNTFGWIETATEAATGGEYLLTGSMLKLSVPEPFTPNDPAHTEDALVLVEAMDTDGESAVLYVKVRGNLAPVVTDATTPIEVTVGTQGDPAGDGDDPDYDTRDGVKCAVLNVCTVMIPIEDGNLRDTWKWMVDIEGGSDKLTAVPVDGGVMITGIEATGADGDVTVRVWAVDEGGLPMNGATDVEDTADYDETVLPDPVELARVVMVTVDGEPFMSDDAIESLAVDVGLFGMDAEVVGTVFDPEMATLVLPDDVNDHTSVARVVLGIPRDQAGGHGQVLSVESPNSGTATFTVRVLEPASEGDRGGINGPQQYAEHTFTVNVRQS